MAAIRNLRLSIVISSLLAIYCICWYSLAHLQKLKILTRIYYFTVKETSLVKHGSQFDKYPIAKSRNSPPKIVLSWTPFYGHPFILGPNPYRDCEYNCISSNNRSDLDKASALLFHPADFKYSDRPQRRHPWQRYVYMSLESPMSGNSKIHNGGLDKIPNFWNWTMTYRMDADIPYRFGQAYSNGYNNYYVKKDELMKIILGKSRAATIFLSNCGAPSGRDAYLLKLKSHIELQVIGKCLHGLTNCTRYGMLDEREHWCDKSMKKDYFFYLAFENAICKDYATEKLWRALKQVTVPIVLERKTMDTVLPSDAFIATDDFFSPKDLAKHLRTLMANQTLYLQYFQWRLQKNQPQKDNGKVFGGGSGACYLCERLHTQKTHGWHSGINAWHDEGGCRRVRV